MHQKRDTLPVICFRFFSTFYFLIHIRLFPVKIETKDQSNSFNIFKNAWTVLISLIGFCLFVSCACVRTCAVDSLLHQLLFVLFYQWQSVTQEKKIEINQLKVLGSLSLRPFVCFSASICSMRDKWSPHHLFVCSMVLFIAFGWFSNYYQIGWDTNFECHGTLYEHFIFFVHFREVHHSMGKTNKIMIITLFFNG